MNYFGSIFAMVACIVMSAYFSATETAFSSLNKTRLKVLADNGNKRAALALKLSEDYDKLISTILIGNNIVNIMVASIGTLLRHRRDRFHHCGQGRCPDLWRDHPKKHCKGHAGALCHVQCALYPALDLGADPAEFSLLPVEKAGFSLLQDK